jgi:hypothetical protein
MTRPQYKIKPKVTLKSRLNNQIVEGDIIAEEEIDGEAFWIMRTHNRVLKLAKSAYTVVKK